MDLLAEEGIRTGGLLADSGGNMAAALALLMDELAHGVLITTLEGKLLHANQAARHELARRRVLAAHGDVLQACMGESSKILQDALVRVGDGKRSLIELVAAEGPPLAIAAVPLKMQGTGRAPRAALLFARAAVCDSLTLCFFARSHGLTPTEEQVLGILCQGYSAPQIAVQLNVAVSTVRSHVRSLCAKTRAGGVRELVSRIAVLPPVAPPFWHEPLH
jgi:DNA-binding CsgD family transcriptional regulator